MRRPLLAIADATLAGVAVAVLLRSRAFEDYCASRSRINS